MDTGSLATHLLPVDQVRGEYDGERGAVAVVGVVGGGDGHEPGPVREGQRTGVRAVVVGDGVRVRRGLTWRKKKFFFYVRNCGMQKKNGILICQVVGCPKKLT